VPFLVVAYITSPPIIFVFPESLSLDPG